MPRVARVVVVLALLATATAGPAADVVLTGGQKLTGTVVAVDGKGVTVKTGDADPVLVPVAELQSVELAPLPPPRPADTKFNEMELTDGSTLKMARFAVKGKRVEPEWLPPPAGMAPPVVDLPLGTMFHVLRRADDAKNRDEWRTVVQNRGKRDLYAIRQVDGLKFLRGTLVEGTPAGDKLVFQEEDGQRSELLLSRATGGLVLVQPTTAAPPPLCRVTDVFGNTLVAQTVTVTDAAFVVKTVAGATFAYPAAGAVVRLDFSQGNAAYLSDLIPVVTPPAFDPDLPVRDVWYKDHGRGKEPLRVGTGEVKKGVWVRATNTPTVLTFPLTGDFRELRLRLWVAAPGYNGRAGDSASSGAVRVKVEADGRVLFDEAVPANTPRDETALDVKGAKAVRVTVEAVASAAVDVGAGLAVVLADARVQK